MSDLERRALLGAAGLVGVAALMKAAKGGPIDPPGGPVGPSGHSLDDVYNKVPTLPNGTGDGRIPIPGGTSAVTISQSGSYVLTGNIVTTTAAAVFITVSNVTLDLNGFQLSAAAGPGGAVYLTPTGANTLTNITVRNGTIVGGGAGVAIGSCVGVTVENLRIVGPKQYGVQTTNPSTRGITVRNCTFVDIGALTTGTDGALTIAAIFLQNSVGSIVTDNTIGRLLSNGASGSMFFGIYPSGPGAGAVFVARNCINCSPSITAGSGNASPTSGGIFFGAAITGIVRDNSVQGIAPAYSAYGNMVNGGGNVG